MKRLFFTSEIRVMDDTRLFITYSLDVLKDSLRDRVLAHPPIFETSDYVIYLGLDT